MTTWRAGGRGPAQSPTRRIGGLVIALTAVLAIGLTGCAGGAQDGAAPSAGQPADPSPAAVTAAVSSTPPVVATGPTMVVTVPDLPDATAVPEGDPAATTAPAAPPASTAAAATPATSTTAAPAPASGGSTSTPAPAPTAAPTTAAADPAQPQAALNVQLANCDSCTVLATHRDVVGGLSAALVSSPGGRALLLSVRGDGTVAGVINVPYGASFPTPPGGVLPCDSQAHCAIQGVQSDGRALLSAFALTDTGAWRNVSGDDAFPSVTDRAAIVDLDGQLGLAVQDQGTGDPVWLLYRWLGDRFTVAGCAPDGDAPTTVGAVSPDKCLS